MLPAGVLARESGPAQGRLRLHREPAAGCAYGLEPLGGDCYTRPPLVEHFGGHWAAERRRWRSDFNVFAAGHARDRRGGHEPFEHGFIRVPTAADAEEKLKTLAIVQACHVALPNRDRVGRKLAGKTLLEWVVRRTSDCQRLDAILVLVGDTPAERELCQQLPPDVQLVVGPEPDALSRFAAVVAQHKAEAVVRRVCRQSVCRSGDD